MYTAPWQSQVQAKPIPVRLMVMARPWSFYFNLTLMTVDVNKLTCLLTPEIISDTLSAKDIYTLLSEANDYTLQIDDPELSYGGDPVSATLVKKTVHPAGLCLEFLVDDRDSATAIFATQSTPPAIAWT